MSSAAPDAALGQGFDMCSRLAASSSLWPVIVAYGKPHLISAAVATGVIMLPQLNHRFGLFSDGTTYRLDGGRLNEKHG